MPRIYLYVVARDYGFAPNPFHGVCTLATCKPQIRKTAKIGDWIFGLGGRKLKATGQCIFAMKVTNIMTYNQYWLSDEFQCKRPARNGSSKTLVGDNIYFQKEDGIWMQAHSHHSMKDGSMNEHNLKRDTSSNNVLLSSHYYYFGSFAPVIPSGLLFRIGYKNRIGHDVFAYGVASSLVSWLEGSFADWVNLVKSDPFNFDKSSAHYSVETDRIT